MKNAKRTRMSEMTFIGNIKSWLWVPFYWVLIYGVMVVVGISIGILISPELYWASSMMLVLALVIPITYRHLVGGGCSLKYQVCALIKGAMVGMVYFFMAMVFDPVIWAFLQYIVGWNAMQLPTFSSLLYQVWFYAGIVGGFGARIVEVKQMSSVGNITIAGYEE